MATCQTHLTLSAPTAIFLLCTTLVVVLTLPAATSAGPSPAPGGDEFLHDCAVKIGSCGTEVFNSVFNNAPMSPDCCRRLVGMGKPCHDGLIKHFISQPSFRGDKAKVLASSQRTWNTCASAPPAA